MPLIDGTEPRGLGLVSLSRKEFPEKSKMRTVEPQSIPTKQNYTETGRVVLFPSCNPSTRGQAGNAPTAQKGPDGAVGLYTRGTTCIITSPTLPIGRWDPQGGMMGHGSHLCNLHPVSHQVSVDQLRSDRSMIDRQQLSDI